MSALKIRIYFAFVEANTSRSSNRRIGERWLGIIPASGLTIPHPTQFDIRLCLQIRVPFVRELQTCFTTARHGIIVVIGIKSKRLHKTSDDIDLLVKYDIFTQILTEIIYIRIHVFICITHEHRVPALRRQRHIDLSKPFPCSITHAIRHHRFQTDILPQVVGSSQWNTHTQTLKLTQLEHMVHLTNLHIFARWDTARLHHICQQFRSLK